MRECCPKESVPRRTVTLERKLQRQEVVQRLFTAIIPMVRMRSRELLLYSLKRPRPCLQRRAGRRNLSSCVIAPTRQHPRPPPFQSSQHYYVPGLARRLLRSSSSRAHLPWVLQFSLSAYTEEGFRRDGKSGKVASFRVPFKLNSGERTLRHLRRA